VSDPLDQLFAQARDSLRRTADQVAEPERMLADIVEDAPRVSAGVEAGGRGIGGNGGGNGLRFLAIAAAIVAVVVGGLFVLRDRNQSAEQPAGTGGWATFPSTSLAVTTAAPTVIRVRMITR
jgi:hypothetical protein